MACSFGTKNVKGLEKVYVRDEDSDDDLIDFSFLDFAPETFKPTSNMSDDPFLNILCDENMLRRTLDGMGDDDQEAGVDQTISPLKRMKMMAKKGGLYL
ncbi:unnamed protein product [Lactuca virosa]|uniref:Uncharacterized protein n=1 Tax=Lactuca virosa TaxID=75947 RepID=A0AAU9PR88_9ASTR|nr:unnamed protein product [Lactuca virosa]